MTSKNTATTTATTTASDVAAASATDESVTAAMTVDIDPRTVKIGANVRADVKLSKDFVASIRERGVIVPVVGYFDRDGQYVVVDGQLRTLAAIEAKTPTIPAYATHRREDADRIIDQMSANYHRTDMTAADRAKGFEQLAGFGLSAAQIAKKTGYKRPEIDAGLKVAESELATKAAARWDFLTLEQAAGLAEFEQDKEALKALTVAAEAGTGFEHELQRQRDKRTERQAIAALAEQLTAEGVTVIEPPAWDDKTIQRLTRLADGQGKQLTPETHRECPGHAAYVEYGWQWGASAGDTADDDERGAYVTSATYVCTAAKANGHADRFGRGGSGKKKLADMTEKERAAARAERRDVIESNKAWKSAQTVRAAWVRKFLTRKTAPKGSAVFVAATLAGHASALTDYRTPGVVDELLHGGKTRMRSDRAKSVENVTDGRALLIAVGHCCAAYEAQMSEHTWRSVQSGPARYLAFLAANGYELADVEKRAAGLDKPAAKKRARPATRKATPAASGHPAA
ncbi:ParB/RepB/Spo0J family partition protein [Flexivirga caeni]|nr:ParB/RepB/Spo0J family partition protein [Flexivirga caeni]